MKSYVKPEIKEVELFTQDEISLTIPKTVYKRTGGTGSFADASLVAYTLQSGERLSVNGSGTTEF